MTKVLDESVWDNLLIEFQSGHGVEFANFSHTNGVLYNITGINGQILRSLEQKIGLKIENKANHYITFRGEETEDVEIYWQEIKGILAVMKSGIDDISTMELRNLS
jgi:hypothetical protein